MHCLRLSCFTLHIPTATPTPPLITTPAATPTAPLITTLTTTPTPTLTTTPTATPITPHQPTPLPSPQPPMPKPDRRIAHLLANQYGLTCVSQGQEPKRHLECYKGANAGIPATLLSEAAARVTGEMGGW